MASRKRTAYLNKENPVQNESYKTIKKVVIEWIKLEKWQAQELHDHALRLSFSAEAAGKHTMAVTYYEISDSTQRYLKISTKQLGTIQKGIRYIFKETLYIAGLEAWILRNEKKIAKIRREHEGKQRAGSEVS